MNLAERALAQQYARAFFNVFGSALSANDFYEFYRAAFFLKTDKNAGLFLSSPAISEEKKRATLHECIRLFHLPQKTKKLVDLVLEHKHEVILPAIFKAIYQAHIAQEHIELFTIESSHPLVDEHKKMIENFLSKKTGKKIQATVVINPALIAGLRLRSATLLWEYSVRKQLNALRMVRKELYGY